MMHLSVYGRIGQEPREIQTKTGTAMAVSTLAVDLEDRQGERHTQWVGIVTFGRVAETLLKHSKGELVSACGRAQFNSYTDGAGQVREQLQVIADSLIGPRSVRPGGGGRKSSGPSDERNDEPAQAQADFNDKLPSF